MILAMNANRDRETHFSFAGGWRRALIAGSSAGILLACTAMTDSTDGTRVSGNVFGGNTGNVLSYVVDEDGRTASLLGALTRAGGGTWRGAPADERLRHAQATATEIANLEARGKYPFEQPKLYARIEEGDRRMAVFEKLEVHFPIDAVAMGAAEATVVLQRLGRFAGAEDLNVTIDAPTEQMQHAMLRGILEGVRIGEPTIVRRIHSEPRVIVERRRPADGR
jgi:hypothetical protein